MAKTITQWQANNGSVWATEQDANLSDAKSEIEIAANKLTIYGNIDVDTLMDELINGELGRLVYNFHQTYHKR